MGTENAAGTFPRVQRLDAAQMLAAVREITGIKLVVSGALEGGQVGAARVRWPDDGHESVLKWRPDFTVGAMRAGPVAALEALRARGYPGPATELVVQVGTAVVTVQELLPGNTIDVLDEQQFDQVLALNAKHVGALAGRPDVPCNVMYLRHDGPGYCLHEPLRRFSARTAELDRRIRAVGDASDERLQGFDVVHQDFHPGNMLTLGGDVTGVVDWDGAGRGDAGFDLVTLRFAVHLAGAERRVVERLDALLDALPEDVLRVAWAHMSLRMTDWAIRHFPSYEVGTWVDLAAERL
ncbi:phosphotransferase [Actinospica sp. MGRD01-02]|uniref:Phosphotransferase n=1 Tax=Actinospica acidithermotolerans TaxID=2828514 RepID=A0A941EF60_9ACTN|nr:phosphotransferase [Actinospica acidithermotolerans]MBR7830326.1 phosphotransferase [Actinospica acidithermotolerans]